MAPRRRPLLTQPSNGTQKENKLYLRAALRKGAGHRHEVDFEEADITVELYASTDHVELVIEAPDQDRPSSKRRFALANIPRHLLSKAMADLARQDPSLRPNAE